MSTETIETVTIEQVREAQRNAPLSEDTKTLQRQYDAQRTATERALRIARYRAEQAEQHAKEQALKARIWALERLCPPTGFALRLISIQRAQYLMMAPAQAGGWVAVELPEIAGKLVALLPSFFTDGRQVTAEHVRQCWMRGCYETDELEDALKKLSTLAA